MKRLISLIGTLAIAGLIGYTAAPASFADTATSTTTSNASTTNTSNTNTNNTASTSTSTIGGILNTSSTTPTSTSTSTTATTTSPSTTTTTTTTTTPPTLNFGWGDILGWIVLPRSAVTNISASTASTSTMSLSPFQMNRGYALFNGNYLDCNGNIDNDPAHHSTDPNDLDPGHHIGQNCPSNSPLFMQNNIQGSNPSPFSAIWNQAFMSWSSQNNMHSPWVIIPITSQNMPSLSGIINAFLQH